MEKELKNVKLTADIQSIRETIDLLNELNENLKRAKILIDELAQKKVELEIKLTSVSPVDLQGEFLSKYY